MKKLLSVVLVICMSMAMLAGCGKSEPVNIRVASLKGATSLGMLDLIDRAEKGETGNTYDFTIATGADEILPLMIKGEMDIALIPANAAANLYQKSNQAVEVIDINTLGVLYMLTSDSSVNSIADVKGKTIYSMGKGTTPEATLKCILEENGISESDVTIEFKSEATEVVSLLAENPEAIGVLPQPFVTAACIQNENLAVVADFNEEWDKIYGGSSKLVTGVTVVRKAFAEENPKAVKEFLADHAASVESVNSDTDRAATLAVNAGIVAKEPIAKKAIPACNIVCITGAEMKADLAGYLDTLYDFNPELTGGSVPEDNFYYAE